MDGGFVFLSQTVVMISIFIRINKKKHNILLNKAGLDFSHR